MENAWQLFLSQLSSADLEFNYDEVCGWSAEEFEALSGAGLIGEMAQATHVTCDSCPETHREKVLWSADGQRAFIPCRTLGTAVNVDPIRLRRWKIDLVRLATLLVGALGLGREEPQPLAVGRLWRLGRRRIGGRSRDFFFAAVPEEELPSIAEEAQRALVSSTGLLLLPVRTEVNNGWEPTRLKVAAISDMASWRNREITLDLEFIDDLFTLDSTGGKAVNVRSVPIPDNATWQDLLIEVADAVLRIEVGGHQKELSFDEAGFGERDQRLETLKLLAASRGRLGTERVSGALQGKTPIKNRIHELRQLLQTLFPIDGSPIAYHKSAGLYECKFRVRLAGDSSFPTPSGVSWLDFRFVERRDGRLAVTVSEKKVFRAHEVERGSSWRTEEVAQREEAVTRIFSFEEVGLRNSRGSLTSEGMLLIELLKGEGKLKRRGDDVAVLKLAEWLRSWTGLDGDPLQYIGRNQLWSACFECSMEQEG